MKGVRLTYLDSRVPGTIVLDIEHRQAVVGSDFTRRRMSIQEAADLSERLREAVRASGYDMVARRRPRT